MKEMVDAWHFFLNIMLALGAWDQATIPDVAEVFTLGYIEKNAKNLQRQVEGYDGVAGKCPECHREIEPPAGGLPRVGYRCPCGNYIEGA